MKSFLQLSEEKSKKLVLLYGRMNPVHKGHEENIEGLKKLAVHHGAEHLVVASHTQDSKKNPLSPDTKLKHLKRAFPDVNITTSSKNTPTILHHAAQAHQKGYSHLIVAGGDDRVAEYHRLLNHYNGVQGRHGFFKFKKIEIKSTGTRKNGVSASDMRKHVETNDFESFKKNLPSNLRKHNGHAKELFKDVQKGMGLRESRDHGLFKAIFISGGPGSGKDIVIREAISHRNAVEMNPTLALSILNEKHKLFEHSKDERREIIRNRGPLIINGTTNEYDAMISVKEELEELGYETMMVFVNTSNEASKKRNEGHARIMSEAIRHSRWENTQIVAERFGGKFSKYLEFDNSLDLNGSTIEQIADKETDITTLYEMSNWFFGSDITNETAISWLIKKNKFNPEKMFELYAHKLEENNAPVTQMIRKAGKVDSVKDGDVKSNSDYIFKTYEEGKPKMIYASKKRPTNFQKDKEVSNKKSTPPGAGRQFNPAGVSPEYDTRGSGTVYPMSGLGNSTYREEKDHKYTDTAEVKKSFRKFRESIDSPSIEMGVTGTAGGATNKEPLETPQDRVNNQSSNLKKKNRTTKFRS